VINNEQLRELQAEYEPMRLDDQTWHKKLEGLRQSFVKKISAFQNTAFNS
jgi:hypothetical protein